MITTPGRNRLYPRKRLDIGWGDLLYAAAACLRPPIREAPEKIAAATFDNAVVALSVRTLFDVLLHQLALPQGSEILVSAVTIPDMVRVIEAHGLIPVPVDIDQNTLSPIQASLERALSGRTRAILVAHLFGARSQLDGVARFAKQHNLLLIEDCAQAYCGDFSADPRVDVALFSFGTIKTSTALGGALARVKDPSLALAMRARLATYAPQSRAAFFKRVALYSGLKFMSSSPWLFGVSTRLLGALGYDYSALITKATRSFAPLCLMQQIRRRPSAPLLALLLRRVSQAQRRKVQAAVESRMRAAAHLKRALGGAVAILGGQSIGHTFWLFPIRSHDPIGLSAFLRRHGFDVGSGATSLSVVAPKSHQPHLAARRAQVMMQTTVYLPAYPDIPKAELSRLARLVAHYEELRVSSQREAS